MDEKPCVADRSRDSGAPTAPLRLGAILACASAPSVHERLHALEHVGGVEYVSLSPRDMARRRLRVTTDKGTGCAIALPRGERLYDGAVLALGETRAIVVRVAGESWLRLRPACAADAMCLGYHAGNLHWRVRVRWRGASGCNGRTGSGLSRPAGRADARRARRRRGSDQDVIEVLRAIQQADSAFPSGGFAFSQGLRGLGRRVRPSGPESPAVVHRSTDTLAVGDGRSCCLAARARLRGLRQCARRARPGVRTHAGSGRLARGISPQRAGAPRGPREDGRGGRGGHRRGRRRGPDGRPPSNRAGGHVARARHRPGSCRGGCGLWMCIRPDRGGRPSQRDRSDSGAGGFWRTFSARSSASRTSPCERIRPSRVSIRSRKLRRCAALRPAPACFPTESASAWRPIGRRS